MHACTYAQEEKGKERKQYMGVMAGDSLISASLPIHLPGINAYCSVHCNR